ncbi:7-deoxyloganetin glucosyltransferase [Bertholletia excelsa]
MIPFPSQGHVKPLLKFAKLLHRRGFYITFVNTDFNQRRFLKARGPDSLTGLPDFQFKTIPDGLPSSDEDATQDVAALCGSVRRNMLSHFRKLLRQLNDAAPSPNPPVTCIVSDAVMPFTVTAAQELGIPVAVYWTFPACAFMGFYQYPALIKRGLAPLKDASYLTNGFLEAKVDWIPGMKGKDIRLKDIPNFFITTDPNDEIFNLATESAQRAAEASAISIQTFDALEAEVLEALSPTFPNIYTIGPLQLLLNSAPNEDDKLESLGYNLWKEETECLQWLDSKEPGSVIYVNFGSVTVMSQQQLVEFAWGLANSNHDFLWIIRPDVVVGETAILPGEFAEKAKERGTMASWCPQEQVLNHPAVGGFLTHSGWNSTIESLSAGVPMICWPFFGDQQTNCKFSCTTWEVGMRINNDVKRDEVEALVRELMDGDKGKKMKNKAMEWKKLAEKAAGPGGSSSLNLDKFVKGLIAGK